MEALGSGANVLAFITVGIKGTKVIYDTVSAVKDGPEAVRQISGSIMALRGTLKQLEQSRVTKHDSALKTQIKLCAEEISSWAEIIETLQICPSERASGRFWRRFKTVLGEKQLDTINARVTQHVSMLSLRFNVLTSEAIYEMRENSDNLQRTAFSNVDALLQKQTHMQSTQLSSLESNISSDISAIEHSIQNRFSSVQQAIEAIPYVSGSDMRTMNTLLQQIKDQLNSVPNQHHSPHEKTIHEITCEASYNTAQQDSKQQSISQDVIDSIDQLSSLIHEKNRMFDTYVNDDDDAECIIQQLRTLDQAAQRRRDHIQQLSSLDSIESGDSVKTFNRLMNRFGRSFGQGSLSINPEVRKKPRFGPLEKIHQAQSYYKVDLEIGTLSLMVRKRTRNGSNSASKRPRIDYDMKTTFMPNQRYTQYHMLVASTLQQEHSSGSVFSSSYININGVLPAGSRVFELVRNGMVKELKEMFQKGEEASLRVHDEYGASLLFYATRQPEMCQFLVDSGLDVDHVANIQGAWGYEVDSNCASLLQTELNDIEEDVHDLYCINHCRKILLDANADPTLDLDPNFPPYLMELISNGDMESIKLALNSETVQYSVDIKNYRDSRGQSLFLQSCAGYGKGIQKQVIHYLLDLGSNIHDRDNNGQTCLHLSVMPGNVGFQQFEAIKYLVERGANVFAVDNFGKSVSDLAYIYNYKEGIYGGYLGDVWDCVLHSLGFNIAHFRSFKNRRKAIYTTRYTRHHFEELWKGRESQCPYWDDTTWPSPPVIAGWPHIPKDPYSFYALLKSTTG